MKNDYKIISFSDSPNMVFDENFDFLLKETAEELNRLNSEPHLVNTDVLKKLICAKNILEHLSKEYGFKVTYELCEPFYNVGSVSINAKEISFINTQMFKTACCLASNVNVYPRTDKTVQLDLTFHGLAKKSIR